jgi:hypothetical protein
MNRRSYVIVEPKQSGRIALNGSQGMRIYSKHAKHGQKQQGSNMQMMSPLGKYSQVIAAAMAVACIVGGGAALVFVPLTEQATTIVMGAFFTALGAVFGSVATVNGVKPDIQAAHTRLDAVHAPNAAEAQKQVSADVANG